MSFFESFIIRIKNSANFLYLFLNRMVNYKNFNQS